MAVASSKAQIVKDVNGKDKTQTIGNVNPSAPDDAVAAVANTFGSLQKYPVKEIRRVDTHIITA